MNADNVKCSLTILRTNGCFEFNKPFLVELE